MTVGCSSGVSAVWSWGVSPRAIATQPSQLIACRVVRSLEARVVSKFFRYYRHGSFFWKNFPKYCSQCEFNPSSVPRSTDTNRSLSLENNSVARGYGLVRNATNDVIPVSPTTLESINRNFYLDKSLVKINTNWFNLFECNGNTFR